MKPLYSLLSIWILCMLLSCQGHTDVNCTDPEIKVRGIGFTFSDLAVMRVYAYQKNNLFDSLIDSSFLDYGPPGTYDTTTLTTLSTDHDYKITMPAIGKTYLITGITQRGITHQEFTYTIVPLAEHKLYTCFNPIAHCSVNGVDIAAYGSQSDRSDTLYIQK